MGKSEFVPAVVPDFPRAQDFEACDYDCDSCDRSYDSKIAKSIDMELPLYGGVAPLSVHLCCCTGRTDWLHTIEDEQGSLAARIGQQLQAHSGVLSKQDRVVLSNISVEEHEKTKDYTGSEILIISPDFCKLTNVQPTDKAAEQIVQQYALQQSSTVIPANLQYTSTPMKFRAIVLICSHMRRDARCGKTAPILMDEFDEQLRERDLLYDSDEHDDEAGRVLISCVSHIGGHKFAGNVLIYRRRDEGGIEGIWLGRVFPHHVGYIIDQTIVGGAVPYPLLRGGVRW